MNPTEQKVRNHKLVEVVDDERELEQGIWVYLAHGWYYDDPGSHIVHEDSWSVALRCVRAARKCECEQCHI